LKKIQLPEFKTINFDISWNKINKSFISLKTIKMKKTTLFLAALLTALLVEAQITFQKTYGGNYIDSGNSVLQTADGGYILTGAYRLSENNSDICLIKTDELGNQVWMETYGGEYDECGISLIQTTENGYFIVGNQSEDMMGEDFDIFIVKTDENGNILLTKTYGADGVDYIVSDCQQTNDNGYILTGRIENGDEDVLLMNLDEFGDSLWTKTFKGNYGGSVQQTSDNGYIISGSTDLIGFYSVAYLIKTDEIGDTIWTKIYSEVPRGGPVIQTDEGGYLISGYGYDISLIRTDSNGDILWTKTYINSGYEYPTSIIKTTDGNFLILSKFNESGATPENMLMRKIDQNGNILWTNSYELGGGHSSCIEETGDNGFIVTGQLYNDTKGSYDIFLLKTNENGLVMGTGENFDNTFSGKIFPNPSKGLFTLEFGNEIRNISSIEIVDLNGKTVYQRNIDGDKNDKIRIDLSNYRKGMLFLKLFYDNTVFIEKIVVH